ncbi:hypothetical protein C2857_001730 [Epichloe festucae Fl1]|uniref:Postreplication repair E3 ubiquitin-protein ligase RAD18 n=1 Tax=Epichloe festucae (strain Fl1) TaxID=877507 RepID=A0A7S9KUC8_EPIFF|nr:hypothetical protein C2857_001730 [Epichloe festucae Fl1]
MDNVPDSTDWLATPLACLAMVDAALRCQVCKDFYQTPMITSCSHTFCSLCIRRALSSDGKCPLCRAPEQELKLRSNWSMEETVEAFSKARPTALTLARTLTSGPYSSKRKTPEYDYCDPSLPQRHKRKRTSARLSSQKRNGNGNDDDLPETCQHMEVIPASDEDEYSDGSSDELDPSNVDSFVPCPSCQKQMKAWQVFRHLEACPGPTAESGSSEFTSGPGVMQQQQQQQQQQRRQRPRRAIERLPALNYSILKEQALRKKLAELGISNQGPRTLLEKRHKEWINLWNANSDSTDPKTRTQLLQDLGIWEKTQGYRASAAGQTALNVTIIKDKNFDGAAWAARHDSSFKDLIASARNSRQMTNKSVENEDGIQTKSHQLVQEVAAHPHPQERLKNVKRADDGPVGLQEGKKKQVDLPRAIVPRDDVKSGVPDEPT